MKMLHQRYFLLYFPFPFLYIFDPFFSTQLFDLAQETELPPADILDVSDSSPAKSRQRATLSEPEANLVATFSQRDPSAQQHLLPHLDRAFFRVFIDTLTAAPNMYCVLSILTLISTNTDHILLIHFFKTTANTSLNAASSSTTNFSYSLQQAQTGSQLWYCTFSFSFLATLSSNLSTRLKLSFVCSTLRC